MKEPLSVNSSSGSLSGLPIDATTAYPLRRPRQMVSRFALHLTFFLAFLFHSQFVNWLYGSPVYAVTLLTVPCLIAIWIAFSRRYFLSACGGLLVGAYCFDEFNFIVWWLAPLIIIALSGLTCALLHPMLGVRKWFRDVRAYSRLTVSFALLLVPIALLIPLALSAWLNGSGHLPLTAFLSFAGAALVAVAALLPSLLFSLLNRPVWTHQWESALLVAGLFIWLCLGKYSGLYAPDTSLQWRLFILLVSAAILFLSALRYDLRLLGLVMFWFLLQSHIEYQHALGVLALNESKEAETIFLLFLFYLLLCSFAANASNLLTLGRTRLTESLRIREERYRSLIENAPEAIILFTVNPPKILDLNPAAEQIIGWTREELLQQDPQAFSAPSQGDFPVDDVAKKIIRRALEGETVATHWDVLHATGKIIPCEMRLSIIPEQPVRLLRASLVDISERVQMEKERSELLDERAQLLEMQQLQMNLMPIPCVIKDANQRFTYWNPAAESLFGYSMHEVLGKTSEQVIIPDTDVDAVAQRAERLLSGEQMVRGVNVNITRTGQEVVCEWYNAALRRDNKIIGFLAMAVDITDRARAERALRESEARYRRMVEGSADGICIHRDGDLLYANAAFVRMMRALSTEEVIGRNLLDMIAPAHRAEIRDLLLDGAVSEKNFGYRESCLRCMDGSELEIELACSTIYIDSLPYRQIEFRDISAQKWSEREMRRLNADLEQRVAARTAALEQANRELESFSYSVAHDLRAPLRAISGFTAIVQQEYEKLIDEQGALYLRRISTNADKMAQLIDDLLSYARIGRSEMKMEVIDLSVLAAKVQEDLRDLWPQHEMIIGNLPKVFGDSALLKQMLMNLMGNACKFSQKKTNPRIEFGCTQLPEATAFFVRDNGVGFDQQYAHKLFGMFQRLHSVNEYEGTGVGLAIVQRVISRHGGRVWAQGEVGEGACFYFNLPLATEAYDASLFGQLAE